MSKHTPFALTLAAAIGTLAATPVLADHNSPMGAGWANMPNDIHNTRVDTLLADDQQEFIDFVQQGMGADSVNRYLTDTTSSVSRAATPSTSNALTSSVVPSVTLQPGIGGRR